LKIPLLEILFLVTTLIIFIFSGSKFLRDRKKNRKNLFLIDQEGEEITEKLENYGREYIEVIKKDLLEKGFMELKDMSPPLEKLENLFDEILIKKEGLTINFCTMLRADKLDLAGIHILMKNYERLLSEIVKEGVLLSPKNMIRGNVILVFSRFCPRKKKELISRLEVKNIKARLHIVPVIADLEGKEVYPQEDDFNSCNDYYPGRAFLEEKIPHKKSNTLRAMVILEYKQEEKDIKKMETIRAAIGKNRPYVTWILLLINIFMWLIMESYGGSENQEVLINFGANERLSLWQGEYWRLIASIFIHIGFFHLLGNCLFLYLCGPLLELTFGHEKYLIIYILSGFAGSVVSILGMRGDPNFTGISAGASGALFGIMGSLISFTLTEKENLPLKLYRSLIKNLLFLVILNILISLIIPNIDILAHLGGLLAGFFLGYIIEADIFVETKRKFHRNNALTYGITFLFLAGLAAVSIVSLSPPSNLSYYLAMSHMKNKNYLEAEEEFKKALSLEPDKGETRLQLAVSYLAQSKVCEALEELKQALSLEPDNSRINFFIAITYHEMGDTNKALEYYKKTVELDEGFALAYEGMADIYRVEKKWKAAMENAKKAIDKNFLIPSAHSTLGWIYMARQDIEEAEKEFKIALNLSVDKDIKGHIGYIAVYSYRGEFDKALDQAQAFKRVEECAYLACIIESDIYTVTGDTERAVEKAEKAVELNPLSYYSHLYLAKAYLSSNQPDRALPAISKAIELGCEEASAYEMLVIIYKENNRLTPAIETYSSEESPIKNRDFKELFLASCYYYKGDLKKSYESVTKLLTHDKNLLEGYILKTYICYNSEDMEEAIDTVNMGRKIDPYDDRLNYVKGYLLYKKGEKKEAKKSFALLQDLSNPLTYCARAFEYFIDREFDRAEEKAILSLKGDKNNTEGYLLLGMIAEERGNILSSISHYKKVLEDDPNRLEVKEKLKQIREKDLLVFFPLTYKIP